MPKLISHMVPKMPYTFLMKLTRISGGNAASRHDNCITSNCGCHAMSYAMTPGWKSFFRTKACLSPKTYTDGIYITYRYYSYIYIMHNYQKENIYIYISKPSGNFAPILVMVMLLKPTSRGTINELTSPTSVEFVRAPISNLGCFWLRWQCHRIIFPS